MNEELNKNIETEIQILKEISFYSKRLAGASEYEKNVIKSAISSLSSEIKIINSSIPAILKESISVKKIPAGKSGNLRNSLENVQYAKADSKIEVVLDRRDKERFLKELSISERYIAQLKKTEDEGEETVKQIEKSRGYVKTANKFFLDYANAIIEKGYFKSLETNLKKANFDILFSSYVATMFFSVFVSVIFSVLLVGFLAVFDLSFSLPFVTIYSEGFALRIIKLIPLIALIPAAVLGSFVYYPSAERSSIATKLNQELPFAVIHMSAISGSGIAPAEIFRIIGLGKEYPYLRREIRKVLNQINLYGYDLVNALVNAAKTSPNENVAELFSGIATTITSGANLQNFFEKRADSLLLNYRIEREKYTKVVETFLDIYISVVIAAPMVFLLLLVLMVVSGINIGLSSVQLSIISVFGIAILNLIFLTFLQVKQPSY